jgi:phosphoserine phosphatase
VSGNIDLIIQAYQPILGFSGIIATRTRVVKGVIQPVSVKDIQKNYTQIRGILGLENVLFNSFIFGIGNNFYDEAIFAVADHSVLFNVDTEMRNKLTTLHRRGIYELQRYLSSPFDKKIMDNVIRQVLTICTSQQSIPGFKAPPIW